MYGIKWLPGFVVQTIFCKAQNWTKARISNPQWTWIFQSLFLPPKSQLAKTKSLILGKYKYFLPWLCLQPFEELLLCTVRLWYQHYGRTRLLLSNQTCFLWYRLMYHGKGGKKPKPRHELLIQLQKHPGHEKTYYEGKKWERKKALQFVQELVL